MKQKSYLAQLSRTARWHLLPQEADEVTADYRDMLAQDSRSYEELCRDFGPPYQAVLRVCPPKDYAQWLIVFGILAACLILPAISMFVQSLWGFFEIYLGRLHMHWVFLCVGLLLSLVWFWFRGERNRPLSKALPLLMVLLVVLLTGISILVWYSVITFTPLIIPLNMVNPVGTRVYMLMAVVAAIAGMYGLIKARLGDRRWRALYALGLTAVMLCMSALALLWDMDVSITMNRWVFWFRRPILIAAVGLVGTGVSLC